MKRSTAACLFFATFLFAFNTTYAKAPVDGATKLRVENSLAKLPLRFEKNEGQTSDEVKFLSRGNGYAMYFTPTEAVTVLSRVIDAPTPEERMLDPIKAMELVKRETSVVRMEMVGANEKAKITGQDMLPGTSNYFKGNDQSKWRQGVENFQKVHYEEVYPGIDLVYYGNQKKLEYDFIVKPGADPEKIELSFKGTETLSVDEKGNLVLETNTGNLIQKAPVIYQNIDGKKKSVEGRYVIQDNHNVAFQLAKYNPDHNLIIDPVLGFSTYLGGSMIDNGYDIGLDDSGNIYVTGETFSNDFDQLNSIYSYGGGFTDIFVLKLEQINNIPTLAFSTYLGGNSWDSGQSIALDNSGAMYITGSTSSSNFIQLNSIEAPNGSDDVFVIKLEQTGNIPSLAFSTLLGGPGVEYGTGLSLDNSGNIYVAGTSFNSSFDLLNEIEGSSGDNDIIVFKLEQTNNIPSLAFSTYLGGTSSDVTYDMTVDSLGSVYVAGMTLSVDFDMVNAIEGSSGSRDVVVFKLDQVNNVPSIGFSTYLGGSDWDEGRSIDVDDAGNVYVAGVTASPDFDVLNEIEGASGNWDAFVLKLEQAGNVPSLAFSTFLGGTGVDYASALALDNSDDIFVAGTTRSSDFDVLDEIEGASGDNDVFVFKLEQTNNVPTLAYSTYLGGSKSESALAIEVDSEDGAYITGFTGSTDFDVLNEIEGDSGNTDVFVTKILGPDTTPPVITVVDVMEEATGPMSSPDIGTPTVTDNVSLPENISVILSTPGPYPVGTTVVTWTAIDEAGNIATETQNVTIVDTTSPVLSILGDNPILTEIGEPYIDPWAEAFDLVDIAVPLEVTSQVGATPGTFEVVFTATDSQGNSTTATRIVIPVDTTPPVITILGDNPINAPVGVPYVDPWADAIDSADGPVVVTATSQVGAAPGTFEVIYSASDSSGNTATATRVIMVVP